MTEDFLQYVWQHRLYLPSCNSTTDGTPVEIMQPGQRNANAGPDFTDVRIKIGDMTWAGCVEAHIESADWIRHGHHVDPAYNNVVMHVVYKYSDDVYNSRGQKIPTMELHFDSRYFDNYNRLVAGKERIACGNEINKMDAFAMSSWFERIAIERLEQKAETIIQTHKATDNDWEETLYRGLARNFGFSLNAMPFEALARSLPLKTLLKHKCNLMQIEALMFGQAGLLSEEQTNDEYFVNLRKEYVFLQKKYNLFPIDKFLWKFLRLRPINFPTLRIAQFAGLIHHGEHLFSQIANPELTVENIEQIFDLQASSYWNTHYTFGKESAKRIKSFGKSSVKTVIINTIVPFLFVYGKLRGKDEFCARAVSLLEKLPAEKNNVTAQWENMGVKNSDAFISQALLQLNNEYCQPKRCLSCAIGNRIVRHLL